MDQTHLGHWTQGRDSLQVGQDGRVLDVHQEKEDHQRKAVCRGTISSAPLEHVAVDPTRTRRQRTAVRRVDFPPLGPDLDCGDIAGQGEARTSASVPDCAHYLAPGNPRYARKSTRVRTRAGSIVAYVSSRRVFSSARRFSKPISHAMPVGKERGSGFSPLKTVGGRARAGDAPNGRPGDGLSVSLMIGMRALGRGLTSKLVSARGRPEAAAGQSRPASLTPCRGRTSLEQVANHRNEVGSVQRRLLVIDQAHQVHVCRPLRISPSLALGSLLLPSPTHPNSSTQTNYSYSQSSTSASSAQSS